MVKIEQFALLIAFFAIVAIIVIGIYYVVNLVPLVFMAPVAIFLGSLLVYGVCRVIRGSF